eukprot:jgi/Botrbrau1/1098/Bobra.0076s0062.1
MQELYTTVAPREHNSKYYGMTASGGNGGDGGRGGSGGGGGGDGGGEGGGEGGGGDGGGDGGDGGRGGDGGETDVHAPSPLRQLLSLKFCQQHHPKKPYTFPLRVQGPPPVGPPYGPKERPRLVLKPSVLKPHPYLPNMPTMRSPGRNDTVIGSG